MYQMSKKGDLMKKIKLTDKDFSKMVKVPNDVTKYVDNKKGFYFSYSLRVILIFLSIFVIGYLSYICFRDSFTKEQKTELNYSEKAAMDYKIQTFADNPLGINSSDNYLAELVDQISTDVLYSYELDQNVDVKYSYFVEGVMELRDKENNGSFHKDSNVLVSKIEKELTNTNKIVINQNINLDYDYYYEKAKDIIDLAGASVGDITLKMYIEMSIKYAEFDDIVTKSSVVEVLIPLLDSQVSVKLVDDLNNKDTFVKVIKPELKNEPMLYAGISLLILDTIFLLVACSFVFRTTPKKSKYCILRDGLLQEYDRLIVNSRKMPKIHGHNIIDCYSFSELMDAQKMIEKPIIYFEIVKNQKCIFFLIDENDVYEYTLKECDIEY